MKTNLVQALKLRTLLLGSLLLFGLLASTHAQGCFPGFNNRMGFTIDNSTNPDTLWDYQVKVTVNTAAEVGTGRMESDGRDIRFATGTDCCTPLCYWIQDSMNTASTHIWVKVPMIPANGSLDLFMIYGNSAATDAQDGDCTFLFFDDFNDGSIDAAKWETRGTPSTQTEAGDVLTFRGNSNWEYMRSLTTWTGPVVVHERQKTVGVSGAFCVGLAGTDQRFTFRTGSGSNQGTTHDNNVSGGNSWFDSSYPGVPQSSAGSFYDYEIAMTLNSSNQIEIMSYCNNTTNDCNTTATACTTYTGSGFYVGLSSYSSSFEIQMNEIFVREYTAIEPTLTAGASGGFSPGALAAIDTAYFCPGGSIMMDAGAGFSSYLWCSGDTTQTVSYSATGTVCVTITDTLGCTFSDSAELSLYTAPVATITPRDTTVCPGTPVTISADAGHSSYSWNTSDTTMAITVTTPGPYSVTVSDTNGCTGSDTVTVSNHPAPNPTISATGTLLDAGAGYVTYQWHLDGVNISGATMQTHDALSSGTYSVTVTDSNGCTGTSDTVFIEVVANDLAFAGGLNIYPNPTNGVFTLEMNVRQPGMMSIELFDMNGRVVHNETRQVSAGTFKQDFDRHADAKGVYLLLIRMNDQQLTKKIIRQ